MNVITRSTATADSLRPNKSDVPRDGKTGIWAARRVRRQAAKAEGKMSGSGGYAARTPDSVFRNLTTGMSVFTKKR